MNLNHRQELTRFLRFATVGVIGAVVDFGIFNLLTQLTAVEPRWASVVSFISAVISNFIWNRYWTYPDSRSKHVLSQAGQFMLINLMGLAIRLPLFVWLEPILLQTAARYITKGFFLSPVTVGHNVALALVILVVMLWNFLANRFWTYSDVS